MPASTAARPRKAAGAKPRAKRAGGKNSGRKNSGGAGWIRLWPLLAGIAITPLAMHAASILALEGPKAFALLYPWVMVVRSPALHLWSELAGSLSQWIMKLQFPVYGLLMTLTYGAEKHLRAFIIGLIAHFAGLAAVVALAWFAV